MEIRILGCSGGPVEGGRTTSFLVNNSFLVDGGSGLGDLDASVAARVRHVFVSHSHMDHVMGLPFLLEGMLLKGEGQSLTVHASEATIAALREHLFNNTLWPDMTRLPDEQSPVLRFAPMQPGQWVAMEGVEVAMVPVKHTVPTVGFILRDGQATVAFSGDTTSNNSLWEALNRESRLDLLLVEAAYPDELEWLCPLAGHYCPTLLAADLDKLKHQPRIGLSHFKPGLADTIIEQCRAAMPGRDLHPLSAGDVFRL